MLPASLHLLGLGYILNDDLNLQFSLQDEQLFQLKDEVSLPKA